MPLFDKFQQQQMTHQPEPEQTDTYRAINQFFKDVGTGKIAGDAMQYYGQRATQALAGDPMARAELLSMYAPMGFLGTAGRAGKAAMTTRRTDDVVKRLREPMENLPGFDMTQMNALRAQRAKMLEEARGTETIRREALQQFDKQLAANKRKTMLQNLKNSAIQDTTALGVGGAAGFGFSEMAKALNDNVEKIKATRKLQK